MAYCYRHPNRETGLSCSECGRPICTECMTVAPVGLRCPDHSGRPQGVARVRSKVRRTGYAGTGAVVTKALIAVNVLVYLAEIGTGSGATGFGGGSVVQRFALDGPDVANGGWWRLITAGFLHASILHLGLNMLILWLVGSPLEEMLGRGRYLLLYFVSLLAGSGRGHPAYGRIGLVGIAGMILVGAGSIVVSYWKVRGYA